MSLAAASGAFAQERTTVTFGDLPVTEETAWKGSAETDGFVSEGFHFNTNFTDWGGGFTSWSGFAYSNQTDTTTAGYTNETSAIAGAGYEDPFIDSAYRDPYAIAFGSDRGQSVIGFPAGTIGAPQSIRITNTTYAYLSMRDGDDFAKKFGGEEGQDEDYFKLTIYGLDHAGTITGEVTFDLANFIGDQTVLVDTWSEVDLTLLGDQVTSLTFSLASSDVGSFGINTPNYFALDTLVVDLAPQIIADAQAKTGTPWKLAWIGWYQDGKAPWVYQLPLGWMHWNATTASDGAWFYSPAAGAWFWTSRQTYPAIWRATSEDWIYLYHLSQPGALQYYDFSTSTWVTGAAHL